MTGWRARFGFSVIMNIVACTLLQYCIILYCFIMQTLAYPASVRFSSILGHSQTTNIYRNLAEAHSKSRKAQSRVGLDCHPASVHIEYYTYKYTNSFVIVVSLLSAIHSSGHLYSWIYRLAKIIPIAKSKKTSTIILTKLANHGNIYDAQLISSCVSTFM